MKKSSLILSVFLVVSFVLLSQALYIVKDAFKRKKIEKGGVIVEGTAGNTGIGLAVVCKEVGLKLAINCNIKFDYNFVFVNFKKASVFFWYFWQIS